jgi:hypothetical protein
VGSGQRPKFESGILNLESGICNLKLLFPSVHCQLLPAANLLSPARHSPTRGGLLVTVFPARIMLQFQI